MIFLKLFLPTRLLNKFLELNQCLNHLKQANISTLSLEALVNKYLPINILPKDNVCITINLLFTDTPSCVFTHRWSS